MDCLILCGGKGKRLKEVTGKIPKVMVCIGSRPFLDILIDYLRSRGFTRFILATGYGAKFIRDYYSKPKFQGIKFVFSEEDIPLGTGGAIKKAERLIRSKDFLVVNGDSFSEFEPEEFRRFFKQNKAVALLLLKKAKNKKDFGSVSIGTDSKVVSFNEKSRLKGTGFISSGIYLFSKKIFSLMPKKTMFSLEHDFFPKITGKGLFAIVGRGLFVDIGTPQRYLKAKEIFFKKGIFK